MMGRQRGQAVVETAIAVPLFLLSMFGLLWSMHAGVLSERSQLAVRYSGLISLVNNPYIDHSLYALYGNLNGAPGVASSNCEHPKAEISNNQDFLGTGIHGAVFWQAQSLPTSTCTGSPRTLINSSTMTRPLVLHANVASIESSLAMPAYIKSFNSSAAPGTAGAAGNFFKAAQIGALMRCYPDLLTAASVSLQPANDPSPQTLPPAPIVGSSSTPLSASTSCDTTTTDHWGGPTPAPMASPPGP